MPFCICALHQVEDFSWDYEAPNMEFYWNSTQAAEFLKVFLSLSNNMQSAKFQYRSSQRCSVKKLFNFAKFTEKHLCQSLVFNKVAD